MKRIQSDGCRQYLMGDNILCVTRASWCLKFHVPLHQRPTLFIGGVFDCVSRKMGAGLIRQERQRERRAA